MTAVARPIKVFLVDDHEHVLWGLGKLIDGEWPKMFVVGTAKTLRIALPEISLCRPDVVILDVYLGACNSLEYLPQVVAAIDGIVLVLTGTTDETLHRRALAAGARAVVRKEAPAEALLKEISDACGARKEAGIIPGVFQFAGNVQSAFPAKAPASSGNSSDVNKE
jgi:two-component system, NarL family, nitrate/nitrite response regulator NarL